MRIATRMVLAGLAMVQAGVAQAADAPPPGVDWGTLHDILEAVPPPPTRVYDAVGFERGLGPRLERLEQRINQFEERLD